MTFEIGDRVTAISPPDCNEELVGHTGVVIAVAIGAGLSIYVEFADNYTWWCEKESLSHIEMGPPLPISILVERKCMKLWNESKYVQKRRVNEYPF